MLGTNTDKKPGDRITTDKRGHVGPRTRSGVITELIGTAEHEHYLVRWDDGSTSMYYPTHVDKPVSERAPTRVATPPSVAPPEPVRATSPELTAEPGDRLIVHGHHLGEHERDAEILEVRGADGGAPFLVRWTDTGQRTLVYPGSDVSVEHIVAHRARASEVARVAGVARSPERGGKD
jgi:hypothetical protein